MIIEGNINNDERMWRNFRGLVSVYAPKADLDSIKVVHTSKGNWKVVDKDGQKLCLVSRNMLSDELVDSKNIRCEC